jgi:hypothetical protein
MIETLRGPSFSIKRPPKNIKMAKKARKTIKGRMDKDAEELKGIYPMFHSNDMLLSSFFFCYYFP